MRAWVPGLIAIVSGPLVVWMTLTSGFDPVQHAAAAEGIHRADDYVGSATCLACHPDQHASWERTFHRTMTQRPTAEAVRGAFDGSEVRYAGDFARPFRRDGAFWMDVPGDDGARREARVAKVVGSRRYQQYFEEVERDDGSAFLRLPILWHVEEERWLHLNTVFLWPDLLERGTLAWQPGDWDRHRDRWNSNCIFCHNTAPKPGELDLVLGPRETPRRFESEVAELGISCEACHGPGADHAELYRSPTRRIQAHLADGGDTRIVHPDELEQAESVALCGQCHGQRRPSDPATLLTEGPTFRPGEDLVPHVQPLSIDTPAVRGSDPDGIRLRFWGDGTPRLTAYEYQGVTQSPCYLDGPMTCGSCHTMHGGDVYGMLPPEKKGDDACTSCHAEIGADVAAHTKHGLDSSGSRCLDCHMPRMVYGILDVHRSHRIEVPDPRRDGEAGRPHACTLCHLDKSLAWSAEEMSRMWERPFLPPRSRPDRAPLELSDGLASLLAGDALQRASYAKAAGAATGAIPPEDKAFLRGALALTVGDAYPSVRQIARRSLLALERELPLGIAEALAAWDHMDGSAASRGTMVDVLRETTRANAPGVLRANDPSLLMNPDFTESQTMRQLTTLQSRNVITIGE